MNAPSNFAIAVPETFCINPLQCPRVQLYSHPRSKLKLTDQKIEHSQYYTSLAETMFLYDSHNKAAAAGPIELEKSVRI